MVAEYRCGSQVLTWRQALAVRFARAQSIHVQERQGEAGVSQQQIHEGHIKAQDGDHQQLIAAPHPTWSHESPL